MRHTVANKRESLYIYIYIYISYSIYFEIDWIHAVWVCPEMGISQNCYLNSENDDHRRPWALGVLLNPKYLGSGGGVSGHVWFLETAPPQKLNRWSNRCSSSVRSHPTQRFGLDVGFLPSSKIFKSFKVDSWHRDNGTRHQKSFRTIWWMIFWNNEKYALGRSHNPFLSKPSH